MLGPVAVKKPTEEVERWIVLILGPVAVKKST